MLRFYIFLLLCVTFDLNASGLFPETIPVSVTNGIYKVNIASQALIYYDRSQSICYAQALKLLTASKFSFMSNTPPPNKYIRGKFNNWIYFSLQNVDSLPIPIILNAKLAYDSIFIFRKGALVSADVISRLPTKDQFGILNIGFENSFFYMLSGDSRIDILIKNYDYSYSIGDNIPKTSDLRVFEARYFKDNNGLILFYSSGVFVILTILLIFGFQWIFTNNNVYFWYCLYALASIFVLWRNLEDIQPHVYSTYHLISWTDSKIFLSIAVFYTYIVFCATFLDYSPPILKKVIKVLTWVSILFVLTEVIFILVDGDVYIRWLMYKFVRVVLTIIGIIAIVAAAQSKYPLVKFIVAGGILMALAEIVSMFFAGQWSSCISLFGVYVDFILFSVALGIRASQIANEKMYLKLENLRLVNEKESAASHLKTRIANDIHDELGAGLTTANFVLHNMMHINKDLLIDADISRIISLNNSMVTQMHDIIWSMDSSKDSIEEFSSDLRSVVHTFLQDSRLEGKFVCDHENGNIIINGLLRRNLLLSIKEILTNAAKHSGANRVDVKISVFEAELTMEIIDNGIGFNTMKPLKPMAGNGIKSVIKRVKECGGEVEYWSNDGTTIKIKVPLG